LGFSAQAKAQRWRFVDSEYIIQNMDQYKAAQKEIQSLKDKWRKEVEKRRAEVKNKKETLESKRPLWSDSQIQEREEEIQKLEKKLAQYRKEYFGHKGKLYTLRKEKMRPIYKQMRDAVEAVAEKERIEIIIDKASKGALLLYSSKGMDFSDEVLKELGIPPSEASKPKRQTRPTSEELIYYGAGGQL
jgi:outer membrane protein